jgi:hypothetical protein
MKRSTRRVGLLVFIALTLTVLSFGVAVAHNGTLVVGDSVETENRAVTHNGTAYAVSTLGRVDSGEPLTVRATSPTNTNYVHLYDTDGSLVVEHHTEVNESVTFETANLAPGEYLVATHDKSGTFHAVQPVVVSGYNTSLSAATAPTDDGQRRFSVTVSETSDTPAIERIEVVVHDDDDGFTRVPASQTAEGAYTATADLEPGEYQAYAVVHSDDEVVGLSDTSTVTISAQTNQTQSGTEQTNQSTPTATTAPTDDASTPTANASNPSASSADGSRLTGLLDSTWVSLVDSPLLVVGGVFGALTLSTVVYQAVYSLRRR